MRDRIILSVLLVTYLSSREEDTVSASFALDSPDENGDIARDASALSIRNCRLTQREQIERYRSEKIKIDEMCVTREKQIEIKICWLKTRSWKKKEDCDFAREDRSRLLTCRNF